jgi:hypothetical protein
MVVCDMVFYMYIISFSFQFQNDGEGYKALKLAHLLIHCENSIKFEEVTAIVDEGKNKKTRKKK